VNEEVLMDFVATIGARGRVTLPAGVRAALGVESGDTVVFRVEGDVAVATRASIAKASVGASSAPLEGLRRERATLPPVDPRDLRGRIDEIVDPRMWPAADGGSAPVSPPGADSGETAP